MNKNLNIIKSTVFLRVDFNVPISDGSILDSKRIDEVIPTIVDFLSRENKIVLASHLGRPKGFDQSLSLRVVYDYLVKKLSDYKIYFLEKIDDDYVDFVQNNLNFGEILMVENLRFYEGEEKCDENFMKLLSAPVDFYCNDAFSCSHRAHASIMMAKFFDKNHKSPGYLLQREVDALENSLQNKNGKSLAIIGGSKISSKIHLLNSLQKKVDYIFVVGAMANTLLKYSGINIGRSLIEENCQEIVRNLFTTSEKSGCSIILPIDVVVTDDIKSPSYVKNKKLSELSDSDVIVDLGHDSIKDLNSLILAENVKNVLWNGPAGVFEVKPFDTGTLGIAELLSSYRKKNGIQSLVGGGDTIAAISNSEFIDKFTHVSTAGGAFLEYIEQDGDLVGLSVL